MTNVAKILWFCLPLLLSSAIHMVIVKKDLFPALRLPVDGGRSYRGKRIFGDHKTWRGFLVMIALPICFVTLQAWLYRHFSEIRLLSLFDYGRTNGWFMGGCLGLSYTLGELPNSFLKRRMGIEPGVTILGRKGAFFAVYDHTDSVLAGIFFMPLYWTPPFAVALEILLVCSLVHVAFDAAFFLLKIRKQL